MYCTRIVSLLAPGCSVAASSFALGHTHLARFPLVLGRAVFYGWLPSLLACQQAEWKRGDKHLRSVSRRRAEKSPAAVITGGKRR